MGNHGSFSGNPKTEWLVDANDEDRNMKLLEDFSFIDPVGKVWLAPKDAIINGASIPQPLWSTIGSPYTDDYRRASIVHDIACDTPSVSRKEADEMFFHACLAGGCSQSHAQILYAGVRIGAWTAVSLPKKIFSRETLLFRERLNVPVLEVQFLQGKLFEISRDFENLSGEPSTAQLDEVIERHLRI